MRRTVVAGNWKMATRRDQSAALAEALLGCFADDGGAPVDGDRAAGEPPAMSVEVGVAPPFPFLAEVAATFADSPVWVAGQDCSPHQQGAYTGDVSAEMLADCGCTHVILGHSERRHGHGESAELVGRKVAAALRGGLIPIVCVGETLSEREAGNTDTVVLAQLEAALGEFSGQDLKDCILAYEPVWAIGTGLTASAAQAGEVHSTLRSWIRERFGEEFAEALRIQYGGSVKPGNAAELLAVPDVDGALVGGAALDAKAFREICAAG